MAKSKKAKKPLRWAAGCKHPKTKKACGGQVMSKEDRARYTTKGKLRKGAKRAAPKKVVKPKRKNPTTAKKAAPKKTAASSIKIAQTRKTAPGGWKSTMGPYAIVTMKGNMIKGGSFRDLNVAKRALAGLRDKGRKGLKLVKVSIPKKTAAKKNPAKKRVAKKAPRRNVRKAKPKRKSTAKRKKSYKAMLKRLGI